MISVVINGRECSLEVAVTVMKYFTDLGVDTNYVAIARNGVVLKKEDYPGVWLEEGDIIEVVKPVGGG